MRMALVFTAAWIGVAALASSARGAPIPGEGVHFRPVPGADLSAAEKARVDLQADAAIAARTYPFPKPDRVGISPDGMWVAWSARTGSGWTLQVRRAGDEQIIPVPMRVGGISLASPNDPVWSPDGRRLAFTALADGAAGSGDGGATRNIYTWDRTSGALTAVRAPRGNIGSLSWSHDGQALLFLLIAGATRTTGYASAEHRMVGVIGEQEPEVSRIYRLDVATGQGRYLTGTDLHVYEFAVASRTGDIVLLGGPVPGDAAWMLSSLYLTRDVGADETPPGATPLVGSSQLPGALRGLQMALPRISPNGRRIAFLCGEMTDMVIYGGDLCLVERSASGNIGPVIDRTPGLAGTVLFDHWATDDLLDLVELHQDRFELTRWRADGMHAAPVSRLDLGEVTVSGGVPSSPAAPIYGDVAYSADGRSRAFVMEGHQIPPNVHLATEGGIRKLTDYAAGIAPPTRAVSLSWQSDGGSVQGWLTYPSHYDPAKPYPLLVMVHGGPGWAVTASWNADPFRSNSSFWADLGYFVLAPNFRGSFGQGESFKRGNYREMGHADLRDILAGVSAVENKVRIDRRREGIVGWSYGGVMAMFAPTQTNRFSAAVSMAGISDMTSFYGTATDGAWVFPLLGGTPNEAPDAFARSSAINFISQSHTPTLVMAGELDGGVPPTQSLEYWRGLVGNGVPTRLVIYPGEGHHLNEADQADLLRRSAEWFARFMPAGP